MSITKESSELKRSIYKVKWKRDWWLAHATLPAFFEEDHKYIFVPRRSSGYITHLIKKKK